MTDRATPPPLETPVVERIPDNPYHIALIIDNVVYDVLNTEGKQAAQFLAQPKFVQISYREADIGWIYDEETGSFSFPDFKE